MITCREASLVVGGGIAECVFGGEDSQSLLGGEGGDVEGTLGIWGEQLTAYLVGYDAHVEAEVNFDTGMNFVWRIGRVGFDVVRCAYYHHVDAEVEGVLGGVPFGGDDVVCMARNPCLYFMERFA